MIRRLKAKGLKICVWINSYIAQNRQCLLRERLTDTSLRDRMVMWQWDMWQPGMAIVDFTNLKPVNGSAQAGGSLDMGS